MKKNLLIVIALVFLTFLTACSVKPSENGVMPASVIPDVPATKSAQAESTQPEDTPTAPNPSQEVALSIEELVIFDANDIKVTVKSIDVDGVFGPELKLLIENNGKKGVTVQSRDSVVNGIMIDASLSVDVAAGKKANEDLYFSSTELSIAGIEVLKDIEFKLKIFDSESWEDIAITNPIIITTSADPAYVQKVDDSGTLIFDKEGIRIVVKKLDSENSFWGADLYLYIENNTKDDLTIQVRDTSVNGFMIDPSFSCDVLAGKKAFDSLTFFESDFEKNDITAITKLEFYFTVFNTRNLNTVFDSDIITITY